MSRRDRPAARDPRRPWLDRLAVGCRWLDTETGVVWAVMRAYRRAIRLVSLHSGVEVVIHDASLLPLAKGWRALRGAEFKRSFEIVQGDPPLKLVRGRLPSAKALRAARARSGPVVSLANMTGPFDRAHGEATVLVSPPALRDAAARPISSLSRDRNAVPPEARPVSVGALQQPARGSR